MKYKTVLQFLRHKIQGGNYELLYINEKARDILASNSTGQERTCYEAAGFTQPCSFCQTSKMSRDKFLVREFQLPIDSSIYQLSGKIIDWDGREAHIEYITDITERKKEENKSKAVKEELQTTFSCIPCGLCVYKFENGKISPLFQSPVEWQFIKYPIFLKLSISQTAYRNFQATQSKNTTNSSKKTLPK